MEQKKKSFNKGGRKPKLDPRTHRYSLNLDDVENAKFLAFYDQSGYKVKAHFIKNCMWRANLCATFLGNLVYPTPASKMLHFP